MGGKKVVDWEEKEKKEDATSSKCEFMCFQKSWRAKIKAEKMQQGAQSPHYCQTAPEWDTQPRNRASVLIKPPLMRFYIKSRSRRKEVAAWVRKKRRIKREGAAVGSIICSSVDLQCAADLAGPLIACRCNNMDWSSAGVGGSAAHREDISTPLSSLSSGKQQLSCGLQHL